MHIDVCQTGLFRVHSLILPLFLNAPLSQACNFVQFSDQQFLVYGE